MLTIKIDTSSLKNLQRTVAGMEKQVKYATAVALTKTARKVKEAMPDALERDLDRPTPFTKRGMFVRSARKDNLTAVVGFMDKQASYLRWQIEGGARNPTRKALRLPAAIKLNEFGNLPNGIIRQLLAVAKKEAGLSKRTSRRIKVSNKVELFYGDPADVGGHKFPPGIYKRVDNGGGRHQLIPLIVFPAQAAHYKPRFKFYEAAAKVVSKEWSVQFNLAFAEAMRTAR